MIPRAPVIRFRWILRGWFITPLQRVACRNLQWLAKGGAVVRGQTKNTQLIAILPKGGLRCFHCFLVFYCMDFQKSIKGWIKESDEWWTSHCEPECSKRQKGKDTQGERRVQSSLWTTTQAYISRLVAQTALTVDKAAISLPIRDTVSNCHPLTKGALASQRRSQKLSCLEKAALIWRLFSGRRKGAIDWAGSGYFLLSTDGCAVTLRYRVGWGH